MKALMAGGTWYPRKGYIPAKREVDEKRGIWGTKVFKDPTLQLVEIPIPVPAADEVLMKVGATGVCGSDTMFLAPDEEGYSQYGGHCRLPCVLGHEFAGEIVAVGSKVRKLSVGDLVTAETMNWCGECPSCRMGMFNQCENLEEIGFSLNGGYAEYLVAKEKYCFKINNFIEIYGSKERALEVGALIEPLAVAYNSIFTRGGGVMPGDHVAIFGCGPIGLSALMLIKAAGAAKVICFELKESRIELAKKVGADAVYNPDELAKQGKTIAQAILEETEGTGAMVHIDAIHHHDEILPDIENSIAVGAKVIVIGIDNATSSVMFNKYQKKGAILSAGIGSAGHGIWYAVIRLISSGRIDPSRIISRCYDLDEAIEAIRESEKAIGGKNIITPNRQAKKAGGSTR